MSDYSEDYVSHLINVHGRGKAQRILAFNAGYREIPVTIDEFIESDEFLGYETDNGRGIYPGWRERLRQEFPDPFSVPNDIIVLTGCIGAGKSTFARIAGLYCAHKMLCLENPKKFFGHTPSTKYVYFAWSPVAATGGDLIIGEMFQMMKNSPWFTKIREANGGEFPHGIAFSSGSRPSANVGRAIFGAIMTEVNFAIGTAAALNPMNNFNLIYRRMQSRFMSNERQPFPLIIDSSISDDNDMVSKIKRDFKNAKMSVHEFAIWQIKPRHIYRPDTFKVFCGDESIDPFIIEDETDPTSAQVMTDPRTAHRVIDVPMDFYAAFTSDLRTSIRDIAGIATAGNVGFITSPKAVKDATCVPSPIKQKIIRIGLNSKYDHIQLIDYFQDEFMEKFEPQEHLDSFEDAMGGQSLELQMFNGTYDPRAGSTKQTSQFDTRPRAFHIDLGLVKDLTAITSTYVERIDQIERRDPRSGNMMIFNEQWYKSEWTMYVGAAPNDEVPIYKVRDLFLDLRTRGVNVWKVTLDGFQSRQIKQELIKAGFDCEIISVDRTKDPYLLWKRALLEGRWTGPDHDRLRTEFNELIDTGPKIDHPDSGALGDGAKDGPDSVVGSIWNLFENQMDAELEASEVDAGDVLDGLLGNEETFFGVTGGINLGGSPLDDAIKNLLK